MAKPVFVVDILAKEKQENLPYWLDPSQRYDPNSERSKAIREKHRAKWLAEQEAKRAKEKQERDFDEAKHPRDEHGRWSESGGEDGAPDDQGGSGATGPLTKLDRKRLENWLGDGYRSMRYDKRFGETLAKVPKVSGKVFRGTRLDDKDFAKLKVGATYKIEKYSSTSQRRESAEAFMSPALHSEEKKINVFFEIQDSGHKIPRDIAKEAGTEDEAEVILPIGDKYKIEEVKTLPWPGNPKNSYVSVKMREVRG